MAAHESLLREEPLESSSDRSFGIVFTVVFAVVALWPLLDGAAPRYWALGVAAAILAVALVRPGLLHPFNVAWTWLGIALSRVVNPIVLGIIFYGVITPFGLVMRVAGRRPLELKFDPEAASYWREKSPPGPPPESLRNQF